MNAESALQNYLNSLNYSVDARPVLNSRAPIYVWMAMVLYKVVDFNSDESLTIMATLMTAWRDEYMRWNPNDYGNLEVIYRRADTIWRSSPFTLWNPSSGSVYYVLNGSHPLGLQYDGMVSMDYTSLYAVVCEMDVTYFPWDSQNCQIQIKPSVMDINHLIIIPTQNVSLIPSTNPSNSEWHLDRSSVVHYTEIVSIVTGLSFPAGKPTAYLNFSVYYLNMTLERNPSYYLYNIIAPVCIITGLSLLSFFVPCSSGERIELTISAFLSFSVFQSYVTVFLPKADTIPLISVYILSQMIISALCVASGVVALVLNETEAHMPSWIVPRLIFLARCVRVHVTEENAQFLLSEHSIEQFGESRNQNHNHNDRNGAQAWNETVEEPIASLELDGIHTVGYYRNRQNTIFEVNADGGITEANFSSSTSHSARKISKPSIPTFDQSSDQVTVDRSSDHESKKKKRFKSEWDIISEISNRVIFLLCFGAVLGLTLYYFSSTGVAAAA